MRSERATRLLQALAALSLAVVIVALPLMPLVYVPAYTRALVAAVEGPAIAGLPASEALPAAEAVRRVVAGASEEGLPARVGDRDGFGAEERSHLADVRGAVAGGRNAGIVAAILLATAAHLLHRRSGWSALSAPLRWAGVGILAAFTLAALAGLADFDGLFASFHGVFFDAGTWTFPYSSLLVQLFPLPFWVVSAVVWAASCLAVAAIVLVVGRRQATEEV